MKQNKTDWILLCISIGGFAVLSISFALMLIERMEIIPGILFWAGLIIGTALQFVLERRRKLFFIKHNASSKSFQKVRNGLLSFGANRLATITDFVFLGSVVATVAVFILTKGTGDLCYVCLSVLVFSFCMHCIFNGRIFVFVKNQKKIRQMLESKKKVFQEKERERNEEY